MSGGPVEIDLSGRKGVTLILNYENVASPFAVFITDEAGKEVFYYRVYDKNILVLNLPKHSQKIKLRHIGSPALKNYLVMDLKPPKLEYTFNQDKVVKRSYPIEAIRYQVVHNLPYGSPARFLYKTGIIQNDYWRMKSLPQPVRHFVNMHELGHYFYTDEKEADRFGLYHYLNQGYNVSGAFNSLFHNLQHHGINAERIISLFAEIKKIEPHLHNLQ